LPGAPIWSIPMITLPATRPWDRSPVLCWQRSAPDRTGSILRRARAYGESHVVFGVHTASAVDAGRTLASALLVALQGRIQQRFERVINFMDGGSRVLADDMGTGLFRIFHWCPTDPNVGTSDAPGVTPRPAPKTRSFSSHDGERPGLTMATRRWAPLTFWAAPEEPFPSLRRWYCLAEVFWGHHRHFVTKLGRGFRVLSPAAPAIAKV
jgi:hypothetical protein